MMNRSTRLTTVIAGMLLVLSMSQAMAADALSGHEQRLFFQSFESESKEQRLSRLEERLFGSAQGGSITERERRLLDVLGDVPVAPPATTVPAAPAQNLPPTAVQNVPPPEVFKPPEPPRAPDATNYPTVIAIEQQVFGRDFAQEDIHVRLDRLEMKVFGKTSPQKPLVDRVDMLLAQYPQAAQQAPALAEGYDAIGPFKPQESTATSGSGRDVYLKIDELERALFGMTSPNRLATERLDRLEQEVFGKRYSGQAVDTRVARLLEKYQASGVQPRPPIQPRPGFQHPGGGSTGNMANSYTPSGPPVNIQIGSSVYSRNTGMSFSPEMMRMLPPEVRQQLGGGGVSMGSTVTTSPGMVVVPQQGMGQSGFTTYGSGTIQYNSYLNTPSATVNRSQTTTVIQPDGSQTVYSYDRLPAYTGDPALFHSLNDLEIRMYGKANPNEPFPAKLARLESALLGRTYVGAPDAQRITNLQRAYQYQSLSRVLGNPPANPSAAPPVLGIPINPGR